MAKNRSADNREPTNDSIDSGSDQSGMAVINGETGGSGTVGGGDDSISNDSESGDGSGSGTRTDPAEPAIAKTRKRASTSSASTRKSGQAKAKLDLNAEARAAIAKQVVGVHKLAGLMIGMESVLAITDEQGEMLTEAVFAVADQYKIKPNPKTIAWLNLLAVASTIYVPKYMLIRMVINDQRKRQAPPIAPVNPEIPDDQPASGMRFQ